MKVNPLYYIDYLLDRVTMYRLVLYVLLGFIVILSFSSFLSLIPYSFVTIYLSTAFLIGVCWIANTIFSLVWDVPANTESFLILVLIISPAKTVNEFIFLAWAGILSQASKYLLAWNRKHFFNPAAIAVVITAVTLGESASWWVGTASMVPFVMLGGFLIMRKLHFEDLVFSFVFVSTILTLSLSVIRGSDVMTSVIQLVTRSPLFFFAGIMLTEPLTLPPTKSLQALYGGLVGVLFLPQIHLGTVYSTPELALVVGNIFSYIVSPKEKLLVTLREKIHVAPDIVDFVFALPKKYAFTPGQYMEWTLPHDAVDSRGNRRFFTIASSPTEDTMRLGVKFYDNGSSYKKAMALITNETKLLAGSLSGSFTLPKDKMKKLVFISGGIGVTPFRSMIKYLVDMNEKRDIVHFFANKFPEDVVYKEVFDTAESTLGIRTIYTITDTQKQYELWSGHIGRVDGAMIQTEVPDFKERTFYLSGPHGMVTGYVAVLKGMGVTASHIVTDFFPGLV
jgi:ferredoxin-NADP reductase